MKYLRWLRRGKSQKTETTDTKKKELLPEEITTWPELRDFLSPYFNETELEGALKHAISQFHLQTDKIVTCIEPILTSERWNIFKRRLEEIQKLNPEASPKFSFHGTTQINLPSIIQKGFLFPDGVIHKSVHGSTFGRGIYSAPEISVAAKYGGQIILCAVATARQNISTGYEVGMVKADEIPYDSNVVGDGIYWVMFHSEQVIPLCVIHEREFESRIPYYREIVVKKIQRTMEKEWKGMSNPDRFLYQEFREVKLRLPMILEEDERYIHTFRTEFLDSLKII